MKTRLILLLLGCVVVASAGAVQAGQESLPFLKVLRLERASEGNVGVFELDEAIFSETDKGYANLRLFDDYDREVPLLVRSRRGADGDRAVRVYSVQNLVIEEKSRRGETVLELLVSSPPLTSIALVTDERNFSRKARVEGFDETPGTRGWVRVAAGRVSRIDAGGVRSDELALHFGRPYRFRRYRLTIVNGDSPPLRITDVEPSGEVREGIFFRDLSAEYRLLYGGGGVKPPVYDEASVLARTTGEDGAVYSLGSREDNPEYTTGLGRSFASGRTLLVLAVVAMVTLLVWLIVKGAGRMEAAS